MTFHDLGDVAVPEPASWVAPCLVAGLIASRFLPAIRRWCRQALVPPT